MAEKTAYKMLITKKVGMTQLPADKGGMTPVTLLAADPCIVTQIKYSKKDGYEAIQLNCHKKKMEFRLKDIKERPAIKVGDKLTVAAFQPGDRVWITATAKGKGFQGVVKRHGFKGASASHGTKHAHRQPGSIGSAFPQHVFKGLKMAGRMGGGKYTLRNVEVIAVDVQAGIITVKGPVPGPRHNLVKIFAH